MSIWRVAPVRGCTRNSSPVFDWTMISQLPRAAMPFALNPGWSLKSPLSGISRTADGSGSRPRRPNGTTASWAFMESVA